MDWRSMVKKYFWHRGASLRLLGSPKLISIIFLSTQLSGQQSKLQILQQLDLQKLAFTFCKGNFGGVKGKEFICVMFVDGSLKFFEQDGISQSCALPGNRAIPTNFIYIPRTDCFVLQAPNWDLECYRLCNESFSCKKSFLKPRLADI